MPPLKIGLIGCGRLGRDIHLRVLTRLPDVELVAVAEADPRRREEAHRRVPRAVAVAGYEELVAMPEVEAVVICLPNALHVAAAAAALREGKHIYLEKPLATSVGEARDLVAAWRRAGTVGMVGFNYRFHPHYHAARRCLQSGRLGELVSARTVFATASYPLPEWTRTRESGGGALLDLASHHVDLVHFLFGREVVEVFADLRSERGEGDSATLHLRLAGGMLIQSFFSLSAVDEERFEVYGREGKMTVDRCGSLDVQVTPPTHEGRRLRRLWDGLRALRHCPSLVERVCAPGHEPSYRVALARFVAAARAREAIRPDLWDGYRSLAVIEGAEESARTGRVVRLGDPVEAGVDGAVAAEEAPLSEERRR